jgi:hypothetical protein
MTTSRSSGFVAMALLASCAEIPGVAVQVPAVPAEPPTTDTADPIVAVGDRVLVALDEGEVAATVRIVTTKQLYVRYDVVGRYLGEWVSCARVRRAE